MIRASLGMGAVVLGGVIVACSASDSGNNDTQSTSAAVAGNPDTHCGGNYVKVDQAACTAAPSDDDAGTGDDTDGGASGGDDNDYGDTLFGSDGYDDDCKYHVSWTSSPVTENAGVTFRVTIAYATDNTPVTGIATTTYIESYLDENHPAGTKNTTTVESPPGVYGIGPVTFPSAGHWTVRFHIAGGCTDSDNSPHGHAAFYVNVP